MNYDNYDALYHHGVLGQRWGIRRYQNYDGSLKNAGKARRRYGEHLDINDKSRTNIAKIRKGEARRRLDYAKKNDPTNYKHIAELRTRYKTAKKQLRAVKGYDKGAKMVAKGQTITGNKFRSYAASGAAIMGSRLIVKALNSRLSTLVSEGRWTPAHTAVASGIAKVGSYTLQGAAVAYGFKKTVVDNNRIRQFNNQHWTGNDSIKRVGSQEYADVVSRRKEK